MTFSVVFVAGFLVGCGQEDPVSNSSAFLQKSIYNFLSVKSLRYDLGFELSKEGEGGDVDAGVNGSFSSSDPENKGLDINLIADITDITGTEYKIDMSARSIGEDFYVRLSDLPAIPNFPVEVFSKLVGPWWKIDAGQLAGDMSGLGMPSASADEELAVGGSLELATPVASADEELASLASARDANASANAQMKELVLTSKFFKDIEFDGTEKVNGYDAYCYDVQLDADGMAEFMGKSAEIKGEPIGQQFGLGLFSLSDVVNFEGSVWVDSVSETLVKADGIVFMTDPKTKEVVEIEVAVSFSDLNMPFSVEAPVDYEVFDLAVFFGEFFQSGIMGGMGEVEDVGGVKGVEGVEEVTEAPPSDASAE